jgi:hypothetical protein
LATTPAEHTERTKLKLLVQRDVDHGMPQKPKHHADHTETSNRTDDAGDHRIVGEDAKSGERVIPVVNLATGRNCSKKKNMQNATQWLAFVLPLADGMGNWKQFAKEYLR